MSCRLSAIAIIFAAAFASAQQSGSVSTAPGFVGEQDLRTAIQNGFGTALRGVKPAQPPPKAQIFLRPALPIRIVVLPRKRYCAVRLREAHIPPNIDEQMLVPRNGTSADGKMVLAPPAPPCPK